MERVDRTAVSDRDIRICIYFLLIGAAGITVSWFRYFEAYKEGISNKSLSAIVTVYMTVGFMIETLAYALKGR